jgi:hypothetical protein
MKLTLGPCEIVGVFGPVASGKTYLITQWLKECTRYVRFDVTGETTHDPSVEHFWSNQRGLFNMYQRIKERPYYFRIAYHPGIDLEWEFRKTLSALWRRVEIFKTLVCDEIHEICSLHGSPEEVRTMFRYGRHAHLSIIGASQRLADVDKLYTSSCRKIIIFRSEEARDYAAVEDRWGTDCADAMDNLRPLIYDDVNRVTHQIPQCLVIPRGGSPQVYDFKTDQFLSIQRLARLSKARQQDEDEDSEYPEEIQRENPVSEPGPIANDRDAGSRNAG